MNNDHIRVNAEGNATAYIGHDATSLFQVKMIIHGFKALKFGMKLSRGATATNLFKLTKRYTNKSYKRGAYDEAIADLEQWKNAMQAALPVIGPDENV